MLGQSLPSQYSMNGGTGSFQGTGMTPVEGKRTFKAKLQGIVQEAEFQEQQAQREASLQDKKSLSIAMLVEGRPSAFCDFFRLTHVEATASGGNEIPIESLLLLKTQLVKGDEARRMGRAEEMYTCYKALAKYFTQLGDLRTAEFFFQRGLNVAHDVKWVPGELEANLALGVVYEELQDTESAIMCHERRLELAGQHMMAQDMETAYASLTKVYQGQAEKLEKAGDLVGSLDSYAKCLTAAERAGDAKVMAEAHYHTGMILFQRRKWHDAIFHLRQYLQRANAMMDKVAEGVATTTLAQCLKEVSDIPGATSTLEDYLGASQRGGEQTGPAIACCSLGSLYFEQRPEPDYAKAVTYFEKFFDISRQLTDRRIVDTARFNLGVARGALRMSKYMGIVHGDLLKLLQFKNARADL